MPTTNNNVRRKSPAVQSPAVDGLADTRLWDRTDTLLLKGVGILLIVLHNFFHLVAPLPRENEFAFSKTFALAFWTTVFDSPTDFIRCTFSFLGHFGVQIFIVVSAYGLARKFDAKPPSYGAFLLSRYRKVYPFFMAAIFFWLLKIAIFSGPSAAAQRLLSKDLLWAFLGISNVIPGQALRPIGPWWFIGFIFQFYCVFPFLHAFARRAGGRGLLCLAGAGLAATVLLHDPLLANLNLNLYYTWLAHLPEICLGVYLAGRTKIIPHVRAFVILAAMVFLLGICSKQGWYMNHISALVLLLAACEGLRRMRVQSLKSLLAFYGMISMPMFLTNAYLRHPLIDTAARQADSPAIVVYALLFLLLVTVAAAALHFGLLHFLPACRLCWTRVLRKSR